MGHIQHLSFESLIKMDHFQKEQPVNLKGTTGAQGGAERGQYLKEQIGNCLRLNVRFGSKADICAATSHVRFTPNSDCESEIPQKGMSALPPKADMCDAMTNVRFGPKADIERVIRGLVSPQTNCPGGRSDRLSLKIGCGGTLL